MLKIKRFDTFNEFYIYNLDFINSNPMLNVFLIRKINEVFEGKTTLFKFFNIEDNNNTHLIVLFVTDFCLIYSDRYCDELIPSLSKELEFHKFHRYTFAGNKQIIESLLEFNNSEYTIEKHLIIYKCNKVIPNFNYSQGEMQLANIDELDTLIRFNIAFLKEYSGKDENYEFARDFIISAIKNENLYLWKFQNKVRSIAQIISREENRYLEIGHVYTEPESRKQGFAPSLVHNLTKSLLRTVTPECMLYTDGINSASNRAFTKIGYEKIGDYIRCYKEK